jgi:hypothetical protein
MADIKEVITTARKIQLHDDKCKMGLKFDELADMASSSKQHIRGIVSSKLRLLPDETYPEGEFDQLVDKFTDWIIQYRELAQKVQVIFVRHREAENRDIDALRKGK